MNKMRGHNDISRDIFPTLNQQFWEWLLNIFSSLKRKHSKVMETSGNWHI